MRPICLEFPRYGYQRATEQLKREGQRVNHKKVLRMMKESEVLCRVKRKWMKTTDSKHHLLRYPNLIKGMVMAAILDTYSRKVIGYDVSRCLDTSLTLSALKMVIARRRRPRCHPSFVPGVQY